MAPCFPLKNLQNLPMPNFSTRGPLGLLVPLLLIHMLQIFCFGLLLAIYIKEIKEDAPSSDEEDNDSGIVLPVLICIVVVTIFNETCKIALLYDVINDVPSMAMEFSVVCIVMLILTLVYLGVSVLNAIHYQNEGFDGVANGAALGFVLDIDDLYLAFLCEYFPVAAKVRQWCVNHHCRFEPEA